MPLERFLDIVPPKRPPGRPSLGARVAVSVHIPAGLLQQIERFTWEKRVSRNQAIQMLLGRGFTNTDESGNPIISGYVEPKTDKPQES